MTFKENILKYRRASEEGEETDLSSGGASRIYYDFRGACGDINKLTALAEKMAVFLNLLNLPYDLIYPIPDMVPLATAIINYHHWNTSVTERTPQGVLVHDQDEPRTIHGASSLTCCREKLRVLILADVITRGNTAKKAAKELLDAGFENIIGIAAIIDRRWWLDAEGSKWLLDRELGMDLRVWSAFQINELED